jgi:hypothetical protein
VQELARYYDERLTTVRIRKYCRNVGTPTPVGEASWKFLERAKIPNIKMPVETEQALMISARFMRQRPGGNAGKKLNSSLSSSPAAGSLGPLKWDPGRARRTSEASLARQG